MNRRQFLRRLSTRALALASTSSLFLRSGKALCAAAPGAVRPLVDAATAKEWLARWEKNILAETRSRSCDKEMGEELGWLVSPMLNGFYYGHRATRDLKWLDLLVDWTDAVVKRAQKEPDGFIGWPKGDGGGNESSEYASDSLLGEAMMWRPVVLASAEILRTPALEPKYGARARGYLEIAGQIFQKWDSRDCWRPVRDGGLWVVPPFGVDRKAPEKWSAGYEQRKTGGFSNPDNKQNLIACWLIALHDATRQAVYRDRAEAWWRTMRSRMTTRENVKYYVWNYWEAGGPWDRDASGAPRHWVGVHPNGGYYEIDVEGIVTAFEHGLVFTRAEVDRLIATNRNFMWNQKVEGAKFQRIDGGAADARWANTPGVLWTALVPYDESLRKVFLATHNPGGWGGLGATPWALSTEILA